MNNSEKINEEINIHLNLKKPKKFYVFLISIIM